MKKDKKNSGVAMIVVLVVGAVVLVFCLSLLLVTYTLFSQTNRQVTQIQCKILAQSTSETLAGELKRSDSELVEYLGDQIQSGKWISEDTALSEQADAQVTDTVSELVMNLDDKGQCGEYNIRVTFSYSLNIADDDDEEGGDDNDDQDNTLNAEDIDVEEVSGGASEGGNGNNSEANNNSEGEVPSGNGTYSIRAVIRCTRGNGTGREVQYYELETIYPAVSLK
ncbi:MAG: hypothetical protein J5962_00965 [Lachnospiraceae bacterium]|nr:hypothetical protein [Lachnospiraceae bacterium]